MKGSLVVTVKSDSNSGVTCEEEAKRRNSGTKTMTFEENYYLLLYAVSNKEDTAYPRQLITRIRVEYQFPIRLITLHLYAVCTAGHQCGYFKYHMKKAKMGQKRTRDGKEILDASNDDFGMPGWQSQGQSLANHAWKAFNR
ncbi:hypothetical protein Tco_1299504 [Tanacetum coccineum]